VVIGVEFLESTCTAAGWDGLEEIIAKKKPNRILIGACLPYLYARKVKALAVKFGLEPSLLDVVDIHSAVGPAPDNGEATDGSDAENLLESILCTGLAKLKRASAAPTPTIKVCQRAMVIGGGIAGMTAALSIADHGFEVILVEREKELGGNLGWLQHTLEGHAVKTVLDETLSRVEKHPLVNVHTQTQVVGSYGEVGNYVTSVENEDGAVNTFEHGVTILATGGTEAETDAYHHKDSDAVITQKELEQQLEDSHIDPAALESVVMIQCVGSREEPRNYCSRICCASALKHALKLKEKNPELAVYVLYRDMMSYGFTETYFTEARKKGVIFVQYTIDRKPVVTMQAERDGQGKALRVDTFEPVIGADIQIEADLVVLSPGVVAHPLAELAVSFGAAVDQDGFFQEAESKWRPVDSLKEGIFACGLAHSPRSITESIATAEAAAQRSLRIIAQKSLPAGKIVATVHHSLCSLCERCIDACPYGARVFSEALEKIQVNPVMCQGCGACAAVCPNSASVLEGFQEEQMFEIIDAVLAKSLE
jgi:heterodisulfide reductase subunit A